MHTHRHMVLTLADLYKTHDDNENEGQKFPCSEDILYPCCPTHAGTIHPCQQHWNTQTLRLQGWSHTNTHTHTQHTHY